MSLAFIFLKTTSFPPFWIGDMQSVDADYLRFGAAFGSRVVLFGNGCGFREVIGVFGGGCLDAVEKPDHIYGRIIARCSHANSFRAAILKVLYGANCMPPIV